MASTAGHCGFPFTLHYVCAETESADEKVCAVTSAVAGRALPLVVPPSSVVVVRLILLSSVHCGRVGWSTWNWPKSEKLSG